MREPPPARDGGRSRARSGTAGCRTQRAAWLHLCGSSRGCCALGSSSMGCLWRWLKTATRRSHGGPRTGPYPYHRRERCFQTCRCPCCFRATARWRPARARARPRARSAPPRRGRLSAGAADALRRRVLRADRDADSRWRALPRAPARLRRHLHSRRDEGSRSAASAPPIPPDRHGTRARRNGASQPPQRRRSAAHVVRRRWRRSPAPWSSACPSRPACEIESAPGPRRSCSWSSQSGPTKPRRPCARLWACE